MQDQIIYPLTLDYIPDWDEWAVVREFVSNAMDAGDWSMEVNDKAALVIKSAGGNALNFRHLLLGISEKPNPNAIGQFGEGLKLAMLVLTRMGLTGHIYSGGIHYWNEPAEMGGEKVFKICWRDGVKDNGQTVVGIPDWPGETFEDRFISEDDPRILFTGQFGRMILEEDEPFIYVRGVRVQPAQSLYGARYAFGYNLVDIEINRDRGTVASWKLNRAIGKVWSQVSDIELLEPFWQAVKDGQGEKNVSMDDATVTDLEAKRKAFREVFGPTAVLETSKSMSNEAKYRGADVIRERDIGRGLQELVVEIAGTDERYVEEQAGEVRRLMEKRRLTDVQEYSLKLVRRLLRRMGLNLTPRPYALPNGTLAELAGDDMRLASEVLEDPESAIARMLHEAAHHWYGTSDGTAEHAAAIAKVSAQLIAGYAIRSNY